MQLHHICIGLENNLAHITQLVRVPLRLGRGVGGSSPSVSTLNYIEDGDTELTVGRGCSGKHVINLIGCTKPYDGDCIRHLARESLHWTHSQENEGFVNWPITDVGIIKRQVERHLRLV